MTRPGAAAAGALEAYWPLPSKHEVEPKALAAFVKAYGLTDCPADEVAGVLFQTEEDWHRYSPGEGPITPPASRGWSSRR